MATFIESVDLGRKTMQIGANVYLVEGFCSEQLNDGDITVSELTDSGYRFEYNYKLLQKHKKRPYQGMKLMSIRIPNFADDKVCEFKTNPNILGNFQQPKVHIVANKKYKYTPFERIVIEKQLSKQENLEQIRQQAMDLLNSDEIKGCLGDLFGVKKETITNCFLIKLKSKENW